MCKLNDFLSLFVQAWATNHPNHRRIIPINSHYYRSDKHRENTRSMWPTNRPARHHIHLPRSMAILKPKQMWMCSERAVPIRHRLKNPIHILCTINRLTAVAEWPRFVSGMFIAQTYCVCLLLIMMMTKCLRSCFDILPFTYGFLAISLVNYSVYCV